MTGVRLHAGDPAHQRTGRLVFRALLGGVLLAALPASMAGAQGNMPPPPGLGLPAIDPTTAPPTCAGLAALVKSQGAVVLGDNPRTYQRYVRDQTFCAYQQVASPAWVPTADNPQCFVGYTCGDSNNDGGK